MQIFNIRKVSLSYLARWKQLGQLNECAARQGCISGDSYIYMAQTSV
jgi:hypothetical protein